MINVTAATNEDIKLAVYKKKEDVYFSQKVEYDSIKNHPFSISMHDKNGELGLVAGLDIFHPGVAEGWAIITPNISKYPIAYTKKMIKVVDTTMEHFDLHRLQIIVKCRGDLVKWAISLGFEIEGTMKKFGKDKSDYYIMGRIR